jgi:hypothetical protein
VTHLRKMMLEELQRRNYAVTTTCHYIHTVEDFSYPRNQETVEDSELRYISTSPVK